MATIWQIEFDDRALKELRKLNETAQSQITEYLKNRISNATDPRAYGKGLRSNLNGLWRYRVEDYRIICRIEEQKLRVLVVRMGHRKDIYE